MYIKELFTSEEKEILKTYLKGNKKLISVIRKAFVPKVDPEDQTILIDFYNAIPFMQLTPEECKIQGISRTQTMAHINSVLNLLWVTANASEEKTKEQIQEEQRKNSNK